MARTQILVQRWKVVVLLIKPIVLLKFSLPSCRWIFVVITWTRMLDGKANGCSQWFLSHRSVASGLEKPLLAGWVCHRHLENLLNIPCCISTKTSPSPSLMVGGMVQNSTNQNHYQHQQPICSSTFFFYINNKIRPTSTINIIINHRNMPNSTTRENQHQQKFLFSSTTICLTTNIGHQLQHQNTFNNLGTND